MLFKKQSGVIVAGLALFSMFFGAGDLIWPLILGGQVGDRSLSATLGLLISGVSLPLLGLMAMMLFSGDTRAFFSKAGRWPGIILLFVIQAILGPLGSLPRLITLCHASLHPYMPDFITLPIFSVLAVALIFALTLKRHRLIDIVGVVLGPLLLICLGAILVCGFIHHPEAAASSLSNPQAFQSGLNVGYNTLDLIASFIFAPLVLTYFQAEDKKSRIKKMVKASLIAAGLLAAMYIGLTYVASYYTSHLPLHAPEERLGAISLHLLGPVGAFFSCMAIALSCLTTAIPIAAISASYIHEDLMRKKGSLALATCLSLGIAMIIANLGFMGIAALLSPILQILCPGLILLSIFNILHQLYAIKMRKMPVYAAFAIATVGYFF
jgi:LIVCS family branched-chain amino acid:cation transporter